MRGFEIVPCMEISPYPGMNECIIILELKLNDCSSRIRYEEMHLILHHLARINLCPGIILQWLTSSNKSNLILHYNCML